MLLALLDFIKKGRCVSIEQLSREFHVDEDALSPMLERWVTKGVIQPYYQALKCARRCGSCKVNRLVFYQFVAK